MSILHKTNRRLRSKLRSELRAAMATIGNDQLEKSRLRMENRRLQDEKRQLTDRIRRLLKVEAENVHDSGTLAINVAISRFVLREASPEVILQEVLSDAVQVLRSKALI